MAVSIRLARQGRKKKAQFMVVAIDSAARRQGKYLEKLGYYFPHENDAKKISVNVDRIQAWIKEGAQFSDTAKQIYLKALRTQTA